MSLVLPGVAAALARSLWPVRRLMSEDLPTLDRPMSANSGRLQFGQPRMLAALVSNSAERIFMPRRRRRPGREAKAKRPGRGERKKAASAKKAGAAGKRLSR